MCACESQHVHGPGCMVTCMKYACSQTTNTTHIEAKLRAPITMTIALPWRPQASARYPKITANKQDDTPVTAYKYLAVLDRGCGPERSDHKRGCCWEGCKAGGRGEADVRHVDVAREGDRAVPAQDYSVGVENEKNVG